MTDDKKSYKTYYTETIKKHTKGLKLVLGPTGLGKTYGFQEAVKFYSKERPDNKFIYITSRHQLLKEQQDAFEKEKIKSAYLKSQSDTIKALLSQPATNLAKATKTLLDQLIGILEKEELFKKDIADQTIKKLKTKVTKIKTLNDPKSTKDTKDEINNIREKELTKVCEEVFSNIKTGFIQLATEIKKAENDKKSKLEKKQKKLLKDKTVQKLYPYVQFEDKETKTNVLLGTIHKFMYGFFDGKKTLKISSLKDQYIILDEFDFLEKEMLKILSKESTLTNPIAFVRSFYEDIERWYKQIEAKEDTDEGDMKAKFETIKKNIQDKSKKLNIGFPNILDFKIKEETFKALKTKKATVLFQTNTTFTSGKFYLKKEENKWEICKDEPKDFIDRYAFFQLFTTSVRKICNVFLTNMKKNETLCNDIINIVWDEKNDNQSGACGKYIKSYFPTPGQRESKEEEKKIVANESIYEIGYHVFNINQPNHTLPERAQLDALALITTPEAIIKKLAQNNLVFGLSATTDIVRRLQCFDIKWLEKALTNPKESLYLKPTEEDKKLIETLKKEKKKKTEAKVVLIDEQSEETVELKYKLLFKALEDLGKAGFFEEGGSEYRRKRCERVFATLVWILEKKSQHAHLIFLTSFQNLKELFDRPSKNKEILGDFYRTTEDILTIEKKELEKDERLSYYKLTLKAEKAKTCHILLLNADQAKKLKENPLNYKNLFKVDKVVVITQYQTASNGVNLKCYSSEGEEKDFQGIHLLMVSTTGLMITKRLKRMNTYEPRKNQPKTSLLVPAQT